MKKLSAVLLLASAICANASPSSVLVDWTFEKKPAPVIPAWGGKKFQPPQRISVSVPTNGRSQTFSETVEMPMPTVYEEARKFEDGSSVLTPSTPLAFEVELAGYQLEISSEQVGNYVRLTGHLVIRDVQPRQGVFGEKTGPIYEEVEVNGKKRKFMLTPNVTHMASVQSAESRFQLNALPGKTYALTLDGLKGPIKVYVKCKLGT